VFGNRAQHRLTREAYGAAPDHLAGFKGWLRGREGQGRKDREGTIWRKKGNHPSHHQFLETPLLRVDA